MNFRWIIAGYLVLLAGLTIFFFWDRPIGLASIILGGSILVVGVVKEK